MLLRAKKIRPSIWSNMCCARVRVEILFGLCRWIDKWLWIPIVADPCNVTNNKARFRFALQVACGSYTRIDIERKDKVVFLMALFNDDSYRLRCAQVPAGALGNLSPDVDHLSKAQQSQATFSFSDFPSLLWLLVPSKPTEAKPVICTAWIVHLLI